MRLKQLLKKCLLQYSAPFAVRRSPFAVFIPSSVPRLLLCAVLLFLSAASAAVAQNDFADSRSAARLADLLDALAANADRFEHALPDFVAAETITQEICKSDGKVDVRIVTTSLLAGRQIRTVKGDRVELNFKEIRQVKSVNGKPVKSSEQKLKGIQVGGAFSSILLSHFAARDQRDYRFELEEEMVFIRNRPSYRISFVSRADRNNQFYLFDGKARESQQKGSAWIDAEILSPLRIEYNELDLPKDIRSMYYSVDYALVPLGDSSFVLPIAAQTEIVEENGKINRARHEYGDYKRFSTDVSIE